MDDAKTISALEILVERLLASARIGPKGAFWASVPIEERTGDDAARNRSLSTGTPGIALMLAAYNRHFPSPEIRYLLAEVSRWMKHELRKEPYFLGFYHGYAGLLFSALNVARATGADDLAQAVIESVHQHRDRILEQTIVGTVGLDFGLGGLILALGSDEPLRADPVCAELAQTLAARLASRARLAPKGVYWDRNADAIAPGAGFGAGSAGVEYVLACLQGSRVDADQARLYRAALAYDRELFDPESGNWRDMINTAYFRDVRRAYAFQVAARTLDIKAFQQSGESIAWDAGAAGIMVSRAVGHRVFKVSEAAKDAQLARARIERERSKLSDAAVFTLGDGWGGVALSLLRYHELTGETAARDYADAIAERAVQQIVRERHARTFTVADFPRRGLLNGEAGVAYLLLAMSGRETDQVLFPRMAWRPEPRAEESVGILAQLARAAFPKSALNADLTHDDPNREINLPSALALMRNGSGDAETRFPYLAHERRLLEWECSALPGWFLQQACFERCGSFKLLIEKATDEDVRELRVVISPHVQLEAPAVVNGSPPPESSDKPYRVWSIALGPPRETPVPAIVFALLQEAKTSLPIDELARRICRKLRLADDAKFEQMRPKLYRTVRWCLLREFLTLDVPC